MMLRYKSLSGDTGVIAYRSARDSIEVQFRDQSVYLYNYDSTGKTKIEAMKKLAAKGEGLTTYINQNVRAHYAAKLR
jgi:hypothetical protein